MRPRLRRMALALVVLSTGTACVQDARVAGVPTLDEGKPGEVRADLLPPRLLDLTTGPEDISALEKEAGPDSYLADARLWSMRTGARLRATLQVGRFVPDAFVEDRQFQERLMAQIGQAAARRRTLGSQTVYVTAGDQQQLFVWFEARHMFVLAVASDYPAPRELARAVLEVTP